MSGFARPSDARLSASAARALPNPSVASLAAETTRSAALAGRARRAPFPQPRDARRSRARSFASRREPSPETPRPPPLTGDFHAAQEPVQGRHLRRGLEKKAGGDDDPDPQVQEGGAHE